MLGLLAQMLSCFSNCDANISLKVSCTCLLGTAFLFVPCSKMLTSVEMNKK